MGKRVAYTILILMGFAGCVEEQSHQGETQINIHEVKEVEGGKYTGGVLRLNESGSFRSLFPLQITESQSVRIAGQVYEGLVKLNPNDLTISPCLAKRWEISNDAKTYTFVLRKDVYFHDHKLFKGGKGRKLTAYDVAFAFKNICSPGLDNKMFWLFENKLKGANEYYKKVQEDASNADLDIAGIRALNDTILELELNYPFSGFLNVLSHPGCWIYPKELSKASIDKKRFVCVGTGPFVLEKFDFEASCVLNKNPKYWGLDENENTLPYLNQVKIFFLEDKKKELEMFRNGQLDMVYTLPLEYLNRAVSDLEGAIEGENIPSEVQVISSMITQFYGFSHDNEVFQNKYVRLAFNYAIDRSAISKYVLLGDARPASYGIVPPVFKGYPYDEVEGYYYDPELAKEYMKKAGYPNGKNFPFITLYVNTGGKNNKLIAGNITKMLHDVLNIDVEIVMLPFAELVTSVEKGKIAFWRSAWAADYPDPENFLHLLYNDPLNENKLNLYDFHNSTFDSLIQLGLQTIDQTKRYHYYAQAEQVAINEGAIMPIYYDEITRLISKRVQNFPPNAIEYRDLSRVYVTY